MPELYGRAPYPAPGPAARDTRRYLRRSEAGLPGRRLVCFGHAGAGASAWRPWAAHMPRGVELVAVQLPGREDRLREPLVRAVRPVAQQIAAEVRALRGPPLALFGHSLGAALAFEVALRLEEEWGIDVEWLGVSGREGPVDRMRSGHLLDDDELWRLVGEGGGTRREVYESAELRELYLPILRNDYLMSECYEPEPGRRVRCPIVACTGRGDAEVDAGRLAEQWGSVTAAGVRVVEVDGGHFYLFDQPGTIIREIL